MLTMPADSFINGQDDANIQLQMARHSAHMVPVDEVDVWTFRFSRQNKQQEQGLHQINNAIIC